MDGILCVMKPVDFTSFDVVAKLRGIVGQRKIGHGGTLDPFATGVLPIYLGKATRVCDILPVDTKVYIATFSFGMTTDTLDVTGEITGRSPADFSRQDLEKALLRFEGEITQIPPMYSAVKVGGRKLYDLARAGIETERPSRQVVIDSIRLLHFDQEAMEAELEISCGKGTYIRTLADDIGRALGTLCVVKTLCRSRSGLFTLEDCHTLEDLQAAKNAGRLEELVRPIDCVFAPMEQLTVTDVEYTRLMNGQHLSYDHVSDGIYATYGENCGFLGICNIDQGVLSVNKVFGERQDVK